MYLKSRSIDDHPVLDLQYLSDPHDVNVLVGAHKLMRKSVEVTEACVFFFIPLAITNTVHAYSRKIYIDLGVAIPKTAQRELRDLG